MAPEKTLIRIWREFFTVSLAGVAVLAFWLPLRVLPLLLLVAFVVPLLMVWGVRCYRNRRDRDLV